ncbi:MAG: Fe-S cluster assembly protein SufD [Candidatus Marinimicrobia bacterium]|jgi:Fe-S cluster assembly protein SufD|nr:Fe-S cluster assembly protein SufD [Candidatus Neomarinimicrobiota bacterium]|tara:strand:- start:3191 stop:4477 length:1287 start_codon:yes stop_codon:yes gene_type:complete
MSYLEDQFSAHLTASNHEPQSLKDLRNQAFGQFHEIGFPARNWEEWRFTGTAAVEKAKFRLTGSQDLPASVESCIDALAVPTLLFVNGHYQPQLSEVPEGIEVRTLLDAYLEEPSNVCNGFAAGPSPFAFLNTAFMNTGLFIRISSNMPENTYLRISFLITNPAEPIMNHPRLVIEADNDSRCTIVEHYRGEGETAYWNNAVTVFRLGRNSNICHIRIQDESRTAAHLASTHYQLESGATVNSQHMASGSSLHRNDVQVNLSGPDACAILRGLCLAREDQHLDYHINVDHQVEQVSSLVLFKYILADRAEGVFNGRAMVRSGAQQIDADQKNKNLLLSDNATMNSNPQLEIYADDVKCTHGSSTGQLDVDALFYLRSRGIDPATAQTLMTSGFANEVLDKIEPPAVREHCQTTLSNWLRDTGKELTVL